MKHTGAFNIQILLDLYKCIFEKEYSLKYVYMFIQMIRMLNIIIKYDHKIKIYYKI